MKNWTSRFVVLMVAGAIMCSALMVGCSGKSDDVDANTAKPANTAEDATKPE